MESCSLRPRRVLHVVEVMDRAGVETWLMNLLRRTDRRRIAMDFMVHRQQPGHYDSELQELRARKIVCPTPRRPLAYAKNFRDVLRDFGPYDVVHSHVDHFSGTVMFLAHQFGIPRRIAHAHNDTRLLRKHASLQRQLYLRLMDSWIKTHSTDRLAASSLAASAFFGEDWDCDPHCRVLYYGIDWASFGSAKPREKLKESLGIPADRWVVGNVARMEEQKNHRLLIEIFEALHREDPSVHLLLVGDGSLRRELERAAAARQIESHVTFAGVRSDISAILQSVVDVFVLPSLYEGLGIVCLEAQAFGLPCVLSNAVPREAAVIGELCRFVDGSASLAEWGACIQLARNTGPMPKERCLSALAGSRFDVDSNLAMLEMVYQ